MAMVDVVRADEMRRLQLCAAQDCDGVVLTFHVTAPAGSAVLPAATVRRRPRSGPDARTPERTVEWAQRAGCGHASVTGAQGLGAGAPRHWGLHAVFGLSGRPTGRHGPPMGGARLVGVAV